MDPICRLPLLGDLILTALFQDLGLLTAPVDLGQALLPRQGDSRLRES